MRPRLLALLPALAGAAHAQTAPPAPAGAAPSALSVSGYGTLGVARSSTDAAEFVRYNQSAGVTRHFAPDLDSNAGLQVSYAVDGSTTLTAQAALHRQPNQLYQPELALAFLRRQFGDDVTLRLGRLSTSTYMISEYQHVGYAQVMMRPPAEVYGLAALESIDGADLRYRHSFGTTTLGALAIAGHGATEETTDERGQHSAALQVHSAGLAVTLETGPLQLRASYFLGTVSTPDPTALATLRGAVAAAGFAPLAANLTLEDGRRYAFTSLGLLYDGERLQVQAEYARRTGREPTFVPEEAAWYAMAAYRFGNWQPYYSHARLFQTGNSITLPATFPRTGALADGVRSGLLAGPEQYSNLAGVRWDQAPGRAVKLQLDRVRATAKNGRLVNGPAAGIKSTVTVLALTLDVVF